MTRFSVATALAVAVGALALSGLAVRSQETGLAGPTVAAGCPVCGGSGKALTPCGNRKCVNGTVSYEGLGRRGETRVERPCPVCGGKGRIESPCPACGGTGRAAQAVPGGDAAAAPAVRQTPAVNTGPEEPAEWLDPEGVAPTPPAADPRTPGLATAPAQALPAQPPPTLPADIDRRPQPPGLAFEQAAAGLEAYLALQYDDVRVVEGERIRRLAGVRRYLVDCMRHVPCDAVADIRLRNGQAVSGDIPNCTDEHIVIRQGGRGGKSYKVRWEHLDVRQYIAFLEYYARRRIDAGMARDAGRDYLLAALIADWYGLPEEAVEWRRKTVQANPDLAREVSVLLYYLPGGPKP
ncbi:MAG: hypothetical protein BWZ02_01741 [Lentisphaerae bacterium ADurb.BinA184]|nr:MAG: hypothetical protein BWZ02_01741 [Lentisphaerae bacterium ADurb.BinA184]